MKKELKEKEKEINRLAENIIQIEKNKSKEIKILCEKNEIIEKEVEFLKNENEILKESLNVNEREFKTFKEEIGLWLSDRNKEELIGAEDVVVVEDLL